MEIERKFLVHTEKLPKLWRGADIVQGYLCRDPAVRVRTKADRGYLTVKGPGMISREEFEYRVPLTDAQTMLEMCSHKLQKTRFPMRVGPHLWEIDQFLGILSGLCMAEIELSSEGEAFERPEWLGEEVSHDPRYSNVNLALATGIPK